MFRGGVGFSSFHFFFAHTLALQVFKLGVWDENLVLHPKLNPQRGYINTCCTLNTMGFIFCLDFSMIRC